MSHDNDESMDEEFLDEDKVVGIILQLGNMILQNLGVQDRIEDVEVFLSDQFYIHFFEAAYPEIDFSQLKGASTQEEIAENIQTLIDLLGQQILNVDLEHIKGDEIVNGNPQHAINLLELIYQLSMKMQEEDGENDQGEDDDEDEELEKMKREIESKKANNKSSGSGGGNQSQDKNKGGQQRKLEEDDEAQIIHERQQKAKLEQQQRAENMKQDNSSQSKKQQEQLSSNKKSSSAKKGRSHSDDLEGRSQEANMRDQFELDYDDEDEEEQEEFERKQRLLQQKLAQGENQLEYDDEEGELDEEDLKMYEQFLADQQKQQQKMQQQQQQQPKGANSQGKQQEAQQQKKQDEISSKKKAPPPPIEDPDDEEDQNFDDDEDDEIELDLDAINPEIIKAAQELGITPQQLIRQLQRQLEEEEGGEYMEEGDDESLYSEGEIQTRIKLLKHKSPSAPYLLESYIQLEPLRDQDSQGEYDEDDKAYSMNAFEELKKQGIQIGDFEEFEDDEEAAAALEAQKQMMQQQQMYEQNKQLQQQQQQQQQQQFGKKQYDSKISEVSKSKESSSYGGAASSKQQQQHAQTNSQPQQQLQQLQKQGGVAVQNNDSSGKNEKSKNKSGVNKSDDMYKVNDKNNQGNNNRGSSQKNKGGQMYEEFDDEDDDGDGLVQRNDSEDEDDMEIDMSAQLKKLQMQQNQKQGNMGAPQQFEEEEEDDDHDLDDDEENGQIEAKDLLLQSQQQQQQLQQQQKQQQQQLQQRQNQQMIQDYENEDDEEEGEEEDQQNQFLQNQVNNQQKDGAAVRIQKENGNEQEEEEEDDDKVLIDLNDLDENERKMLVRYLKQVYLKDPSSFPFPAEILENLKEEWEQLETEDEESVKDIKSEEMIIEEHRNQLHKLAEEIEGSEVELDEAQAEKLMEQLTDEQKIQLQNYMLMQQQQMAQEYQQQQQQQQIEEGDAQQEDEEEQDEAQNIIMQPQFAKKQKVKGQAKKRGRSAGKNQKSNKQMKQSRYQPQNVYPPSNVQLDEENIDPNLLQQLMIAQQLQQQQQMNLQLQQQYQEQYQMGLPPKQKKKSRSKKKKTAGTGLATRQSKNFKSAAAQLPLNKILPAQTMKILQPATPGSTHFKSFQTNKSQSLKKKKKKRSAKKNTALDQQQQQQLQLQLLLQQQQIQQQQQQQLLNQQLQMQQQQQFDQEENKADEMVRYEEDDQNEEDNQQNQDEEEQNNQLLQQQQQQFLQQQQQQLALGMPILLNEEYLNQLNEDELQVLLERQQQMMVLQQQQEQQRYNQQQQQQIMAMSQQQSQMKKNRSAKKKKTQQQHQAAKVRAQIYGGNSGFGPSMKNSYTAFTKLKKRPSTAKSKKVGSGLGQVKGGKKKNKNQLAQMQAAANMANQGGYLLNNFFPALENGQHFGMDGQTQQTEESSKIGGVPININTLSGKDQRYPKFSTENINNPNYIAQLQQEQIDEVPPEQEEGESQEFLQNAGGDGNQQFQGGSFGAGKNLQFKQGKIPNIFAMQQQQQQQQEYLKQQQQQQEQDQDEEQMENEEEDIEDQNPMQQVDSQQENEDQIASGQVLNQQYGQDVGMEEGANGEEVQMSEEQLIQLLQNAHNLPLEQQQQLQYIMQQKMKEGLRNQRAENYQNIYQILMDNVSKAKDKLQPLGEVQGRLESEEETDRRILKQKLEFETLLKQYMQENKFKEQKKQGTTIGGVSINGLSQQQKSQQMFSELKSRMSDQELAQKLQQRDQKTQLIKEKKFEEELLNQQKSMMFKRNAQQVRLCQKVYKLAYELEKSKLLAEKREFKENQEKRKADKRRIVDAIETYYKDRILMLKDRIESEKFERKIAQQAQQQALNRMKKEMNNAKRKEVERYLQLLKQEDQKYDFETSNFQQIEQQIIKMYKK